MIKLVWIGEAREVPLYGFFSEGDSLSLPDDMARDLIQQGFCREESPKIKTEKKGA